MTDKLIINGIEVTDPDTCKTRSRHTKKQVAQALVDNYGVISNTAKQLGISRQVLESRIKLNPDLRAIRDSARQSLLDVAESQLFKKVESGEDRSIFFVLTRLGKERGYGDEVVIKADVNTTDLTNLTVEELEKLNELVKKTTNVTGDTTGA
jgi:hypothetical protein